MAHSGATCLLKNTAKDQAVKVLVVEDEKLLRLNCRAMVEDMGCQAIEAVDGREGLDVFKQEFPDLVLTDLRMPVMDGLSMIRKLQEVSPETPIVVISGAGTLKEAVESLRFGAWDYIIKPIVNDNAEIVIHKVLEKARLEKELREYRERLEELVEKRTEKLSEESRRWKQTFDALPDLISILDTDFRIVRINKAMADRLGIPPETCLGKQCFEVVHGTSTPHDFCPYLKIRKDGCVHTEEITEESLGGVFFVSASPIYDTEGRLIGSVHVARDVTEQKSLESQFLHAQRMEAIGRLASGVAHDFNNWLNIIMGRADLALSVMDSNHPVCGDLREIIVAVEHSADLTKQLLAFSRKQPMAPKVLDLNKAIGDLLKMLQRLMGKNVRLAWSPADNLWQVKMDASQLDQILANLCVNAKDAIANKGSVVIETLNLSVDEKYCDSRPGLRPGDYVLIIVNDDGCGMDKETLGKIFEPFFTTKEEGKGTGLGLATVYGIVKQNNGYVDVTSESGQGTALKIYLPRHN